VVEGVYGSWQAKAFWRHGSCGFDWRGDALRRQARELKEVVAEQTLELRLLKKA
jgi:hypothetical protein